MPQVRQRPSAEARPRAGADPEPPRPVDRSSTHSRLLPFRFPSLTGLLARALVLFFGVTALWRLALLGLETYEQSRFTRPPIVAQPTTVTPATDEGLSALLGEASLPGGTLGVYVRSLSTGIRASLNGDRRFHAASLFKLPVLVEVYKQQRLKRFSWDDELTIGREHWTDGSGVLQARVGQRMKIGELARLMIVESDNIAANMLMDLVGVASINQTMLSLGLTGTRVPDPQRENAPPVTTPEDIGRLLELIATGRLIDAPTSEEAVRLLESPQAQSWLAEGLPTWGRLAHKWGDVPNSRHDAGIIFTPRDQIVIVVMTENGSPAVAAEQIRALSRSIVRYVNGPGP